MNEGPSDPSWATICRLGGIGVFVQLLCAAMTMTVAFTLGGEPDDAIELFRLMQQSRIETILRLDFASMISMVVNYLTFFAIFAALRNSRRAFAAFATILAFIGITLWFSTHSALSLVYLSDQYVAAATPQIRSEIVASANAVFASNMWHSSGGIIAGCLLQIAGIAVSMVMIASRRFGRLLPVLGIVVYALDLLHIIVGGLLPEISVILMAIAGTLYVPWFVMLGLRLLKIGRAELRTASDEITQPA